MPASTRVQAFTNASPANGERAFFRADLRTQFTVVEISVLFHISASCPFRIFTRSLPRLASPSQAPHQENHDHFHEYQSDAKRLAPADRHNESHSAKARGHEIDRRHDVLALGNGPRQHVMQVVSIRLEHAGDAAHM